MFEAWNSASHLKQSRLPSRDQLHVHISLLESSQNWEEGNKGRYFGYLYAGFQYTFYQFAQLAVAVLNFKFLEENVICVQMCSGFAWNQ